MTKNKKLIIVSVVFILAIFSLLLLVLFPEKEEKEESVSRDISVRMLAVGDNLIHSPIYNSCRTENGFNFDSLYKNMESYLAQADICAINQETIFPEKAEAFSGYPAFGTPKEVGESVIKAGFNLITHATNHTYDKGSDALFHTMDFWSDFEHVTVLGINESAQKQKEVKVWEKDGIRIGMLNFTYGLNGFSLPKEKEYLVNVFARDEKTIELIKKAEDSADITVVFMHFGTEYTHVPTASQKKDVEFLTENGADIIIGTHPHVVQPVTEHISENGNRALVFYSLGNFISNQSGTEKILGAMADVTIVKKEGKVYVENYDMLPLVTHVSDKKYSVYMLSDYTDELAKKHTRCPNLTVEKISTLFESIKNGM